MCSKSSSVWLTNQDKEIFYPDWSITHYPIRRVDFRTQPYNLNVLFVEFPSKCFLHLCNEKRFFPSFSSRTKRSAIGRSRRSRHDEFQWYGTDDRFDKHLGRVVTTRFWSTRDFARGYEEYARHRTSEPRSQSRSLKGSSVS